MDVVAMDSFAINNVARPINSVPPSYVLVDFTLILQSF